MKPVRYLTLGIACVLAVTVASAAAAVPKRLRKCQTITDSGSYVVVRNLNAIGDCLLVDASNVVIDLGGFTVTGDGTGYGVREVIGPVDWERIDVLNGTVTGFDVGLQLPRLSHVENVTASYNASTGISAASVSRSRAHDNGGVGIRANVVRDSTAVNNVGNGIEGVSGVVVGNRARSNGGDGIAATGADTVIENNHASGNGGNGISGDAAVVRGNSVGSNAGDGINVSCPSSIVGNSVRDTIVTTGIVATCVLSDNATN